MTIDRLDRMDAEMLRTDDLRSAAKRLPTDGFFMSIPARPDYDADLLLAQAAEEIDRLRSTLAAATSRAKKAEAERDEARELAVWLARWANCLDFWSEREFAWTSENHTVYSFRHDGTDAGILAALRRAMKGEG